LRPELSAGVVTVYGLSRWLGNLWLEKQKSRYTKELEEFKDKLQQQQRHLQAEIDRSVFVTRAHFETEFAAMKNVFKVLAETRMHINGVRSSFETSPQNESVEDRTKRLFSRLQPLIESYNALAGLSEAMRPFYPKELVLAVEECLKAAHMEIVTVQTGLFDTFSQEWYEEGERNRTRFATAYVQASELIRDRISRLAVLPTNL
jgi:anion-transporting  ArsA/GET3 family ATPase